MQDTRSNKPDERGLIYRAATIDTPAKGDNREVELSFASEEAVERYDWETGEIYREVLDHSPNSVDFSRLNNGGALLRDHDRKVQTGVIVKNSARVDGDKKSRAKVKFSRSKVGEEEFQDVTDGIRSLVSVGYQVGREISRDKTGGIETRKYEWMPYEVSTVSIPADTTVGVGRNQPTKTDPTKSMNTPLLKQDPAEGGGGEKEKPVAAPAVVRSEAEIRADVLKQTSEIIAYGRKFNKFDEAQDALKRGISVEDFRREILDNIKSGSVETPVEQVVNSRSVGDYVVNSDAYKKFCKASGQRSISMDIPMGFTRTTGDPATTTGLTSIDKQPGIVTLGVMPPRVADLMTQTPTNNTTIRYISENSLTNAATAVAENGSLPEATWDLVETDAAVKKIGVIGRVTDEFFQDYDATRDYINNRLAYMVGIKEDNALLNADASANQIKGILQFTGIQTQAQAADTVPDAIFKAITKIRTLGFFEPDAIVMNPTDLQNLRLMKDKSGQYFYGGPFTGSYGTPGGAGGSFMLSIWGLPVVWTTSIAAGTCLVGAFRLGAQIFRKLGLTIETTNSDASDFQFNRIAIRAQTRLTLAVYRPLGFCTVTGLA